jgi:hypothetical protein
VIDSQSDIVKLGPNVKGRVFVRSNGEWVDGGVVRLPEGWLAGPGPK